ncbi:uncharacterized protein LOC117101633 [Anneissia japonica]|uniref:uncharacterized protein LOC117101633 n=1 Tax=Anneissia japonica TaxID=1529436 RepID=UPI0014259645|nr:uncharacterized protein LOC117101633 [Anneissia japonica]
MNANAHEKQIIVTNTARQIYLGRCYVDLRVSILRLDDGCNAHCYIVLKEKRMLRTLGLMIGLLTLGAERVNCQEKPCAKSGENGDIEADDNTYYCMATVNNQPSPYTRCCWTDRPVNSAGVYDPNGKTYSCCKEKDEAKKEM